jgi:hypothetical protein
VTSLAALQQLYFTAPTGLYTAGRALGAVSGTACVLLVHRVAARLVGSRAAVAAAVFLAAAPLAVRDSHYVKHDVFATMTVLGAYLAMARVWPSAGPNGAGRRDVLIAGGACGIAFSTHYYCVFLACPLLWVIVQAYRNQGWMAVVREAVLGGVAATLVFLLLSPFLAVEPLTAWRDIAANRQIVVDRAVESGAFAPALRYLHMLWSDSMGVPVIALASAGVLWMLIAAPARAIFLLAFPVPFFLFITNTFPASRYLNPILPFAAIFAGWVLAGVAERTRAKAWMFWGSVTICALPGLVGSLRADRFFRQTDTRTLALEYIEGHIPAGSTVLVQPYSVPLTPSREALLEGLAHNLGSADAASTKFRLQLSLDPYPAPAYRVIYLGHGGLDAEKIYIDDREVGGSQGLAPLRRLGVVFVVVKRYNRPDLEATPLLTALAREGRRIAEFSPYRTGLSEAELARVDPFLHNTDAPIDDALERPGPRLEIWELVPR